MLAAPIIAVGTDPTRNNHRVVQVARVIVRPRWITSALAHIALPVGRTLNPIHTIPAMVFIRHGRTTSLVSFKALLIRNLLHTTAVV